MKLQEYVQKIRDGEFSNSEQLSLGELIEKLEAFDPRCDYGDKEYKSVSFDFGSAVPTSLDSWRGSYNELALGYELTGYGGKENYPDTKIDKFLKHLKETVGVTMIGWKGGDFRMDESTPVWVANSGNSGNTAIVGVHDAGWQIIILTSYMEY